MNRKVEVNRRVTFSNRAFMNREACVREGFFFFSILWRRCIGNHLKEGLAKFGYRSNKQFENKLEILLWISDKRTYLLFKSMCFFMIYIYIYIYIYNFIYVLQRCCLPPLWGFLLNLMNSMCCVLQEWCPTLFKLKKSYMWKCAHEFKKTHLQITRIQVQNAQNYHFFHVCFGISTTSRG
jgi:hypothetical protein